MSALRNCLNNQVTTEHIYLVEYDCYSLKRKKRLKYGPRQKSIVDIKVRYQQRSSAECTGCSEPSNSVVGLITNPFLKEHSMEAQELHRGRLIDHIQLVVRDLSASKTFYTAIFKVLNI